MSEIEIFKALADPIRLRVIILLLYGELCVCDLIAVLNLPQSTISRHMGRLRTAGLVRDRREGKWVHYSTHTNTFAGELQYYLTKYANSEPYRSDRNRLKEHLATKLI